MTGTLMPERARKAGGERGDAKPKKGADTVAVRLSAKSAEALAKLAALMGVTPAQAFDEKYWPMIDDELIALSEEEARRRREAKARRSD